MYNFKNVEFVEYLKIRLTQNLPGINAQIKMAMRIGNSIFRKLTVSPTARKSAVLILLNGIDSLNLLFTLRSSNLKKHSNQISFPGGRCDLYEAPINTAIRETYEETGIVVESKEILGKLSELYVPPSDSYIVPFVAYKENIQTINLNPSEVEEVFFIEFHKFVDDNIKKIKTMNIDGYDVETPFWDVHPKVPLWGATSMILSELITIYQEWLDNQLNDLSNISQ